MTYNSIGLTEIESIYNLTSYFISQRCGDRVLVELCFEKLPDLPFHIVVGKANHAFFNMLIEKFFLFF